MADTLLEQFLVHERTPQVRHLLANAIDDTSMLQPFLAHVFPYRKGGPR